VTRFEDHLQTCTVCRDELEAFRQVVDVLPMSAPQVPAPPGLRRDVMRAIAAEPRRDGAVSERRSLRGLGLARLPRPAIGLAAALAVAIVAVVVAVSTSGGGTRTVAAQVTGAGTASLRISGGHAELVLHRFAAPPAGKIYEVWLRRGKAAPTPTTALFSVTAHGDATEEVPGNLRGVTQVMVTPEPAGGSPHPTGSPVIQARLA
jgi:anti-sigma-K factor RskA